MKTLISNTASIILTTVIFLIGGWDVAIQCLIVVIIIDYLTGVASAIYNKKLSSKVGFKGIIKKFCYLLVVALSVVIDRLTNTNGVIRNMVIYFFVANDGLSILENLGEMDIKLPKKLLESLEQLKNKTSVENVKTVEKTEVSQIDEIQQVKEEIKNEVQNNVDSETKAM